MEFKQLYSLNVTLISYRRKCESYMSRVYDDLNNQQQKFAEYYMELNNITQAAIKAGYSEQTAASQGSRLLKNVKVREYITAMQQERRERVQAQLAKYAEDVIQELYRLALNAESESVRTQAIKDIMDRSGYKPTDKIESKSSLDGKIEFGFIDPNEAE